MSRTARVYITVISAMGVGLGFYNIADFFFLHPALTSPAAWKVFLMLSLIYWICCCIPLYIRSDCTVDMSFISILAVTMALGPKAAMVISFLTYPLVVIPCNGDTGYTHVLNSAPWKTAFNLGNHSISFYLGGLAYFALGGVPGDIALPGVLLPAASFILLATGLDALLVLLVFVHQNKTLDLYSTIIQMVLNLVPSILCSAPIAYFLTLILQMDAGIWLVMLFMLPLFLARFSFKLFLSSRRQQLEIVTSFSNAIDAKDPYTNGHSQRVSFFAVRIAEHMRLPGKQIARLRLAGLLHDVGKIGIPDALLLKPGALTVEEREILQQHPVTGARIIGNLEGYQDLVHLVLHHHEFYNGNGYPDGLRGDELPIETYVLSVADAYDAITSDRPYRNGLPPERAMAIIMEHAGEQFHPLVAAAAEELLTLGQLNPPSPDLREVNIFYH